MKLPFIDLQDTMGTDKLLHLLICFITTVLCTAIFKNFMECGNALVTGIFIALALGVGKELYDKFVLKSIFDSLDFAFDVIGIAMAAFTILCFI